MKTIKAGKEVFYSFYFVLLPLIWLVALILWAVEAFKKDSVYTLETALLAIGALSLIPVLLNLIFLR